MRGGSTPPSRTGRKRPRSEQDGRPVEPATKRIAVTEPIMDLAHLGHVEILTPKPEESLKFFTQVFGLTESGRKGDSVYLRGWDDYERATLKLTASKTNGIVHTAFRTRSPEALERRVAALKDTEFHVGWNDGDLGHGPAYQCRDPDGHLIELYYETEWYQPPPELKPALKNQAQKYPARGISVRRLDHLNFFAVDIPGARKFFMEKLGMRLTEQIVFESGEQAIWFNCTNKSYELAISLDHTGVPGRFHHVTFAVDSREDVLRAADIASRTACSSRPVRTSTRSSRRSSSICTSPAATASRSPMPARG